MDDIGIVDSSAAVEETPLATPADPGTDATDTAAETPASDEETKPAEETPGPAKLFDAPGKLSADVKQTLAEIKAKNPALANQLQRALFKSAEVDRVLPGGIRQAQELQKQIQEWGGPEKVQQTREELAYFADLDAQFTAADPRFIQAMTATPEGQAAFQKLAPALMSKFEEMNPDGYSATVCKTFIADMVEQRVPLMLERLGDLIGDNPKAAGVLQQLVGYVNRIQGFAAKQVAAPAAAKAPEVDQREAQLREREQTLTRTEWRRESDADRMKAFDSEWAKLTAGRKLTDVQTAAVKELYVSRLHSAVSKLPGFNDNLQKYFEAGDKAGFLRYLTSIHKTEVPKALKAAMDVILPSRPGPKPGTAVQGALPKDNGTGKPSPGFEFVGKRPDPNEIDPLRSIGLILQGKAVLRGGRKVYWRT